MFCFKTSSNFTHSPPLSSLNTTAPPPPLSVQPLAPSTRIKIRPVTSSPTYPPQEASGPSLVKGVSKGVSSGGVGGILLVGLIILFVPIFFLAIFYSSRKKKSKQYALPPPPPPPHGRIYNPPPRKLKPNYNLQGVEERIQKPPQLTSIDVDSFPTKNLQCSPTAPPISPSFSTGNFTIQDLAAFTANFSYQNLLKKGRYGYIHKGVLPNGKRVVVKQLMHGSGQGDIREFQAEIETISRVHHKNLVSLIGYCITGAETLLVYEFVPNNTLDFHLHGEGQPVMKWEIRMKIAIGSAKGLAYLHEDYNPTITHRDIKASNILLDFNFEAKIANFGLANVLSDDTDYTRYVAPEYVTSGRASDKSDVYSYGVMLLELISGCNALCTNSCLLSWARPFLEEVTENRKFEAIVDSRLQKEYNREEMGAMVACAAACIRISEWRRPPMSLIIRILEGEVPPCDLDEGIKPEHKTSCSHGD